MIKNLITDEEIKKLDEIKKLTFITEILTNDIKTEEGEQELITELTNSKMFFKEHKAYLTRLTDDLYSKYISIKKLLID